MQCSTYYAQIIYDIIFDIYAHICTILKRVQQIAANNKKHRKNCETALNPGISGFQVFQVFQV